MVFLLLPVKLHPKNGLSYRDRILVVISGRRTRYSAFLGLAAIQEIFMLTELT